MALSNKRSLRSISKVIKSEYFESDKKIRKVNKGMRQKIKLEYEELESKPAIKSEPVEQMDNKTWEPLNWQLLYENIKKMRISRDAAVDQMGAEKCSDKNNSPEVQRFHILISLMLSSQTKDAVTHGAMVKLKEHGLSVSNILSTSEDTLQKLIYPVGFYKRKAGYILKTCQILRDNYDSDIPPSLKELCSLPGVGNKMAYLCMDIAWKKLEGIGVDTHVHRISNRLGWTGGKETRTPEDTRKALEDWLPREYWSEVNLLLVGFGQQVCLPVGPRCSTCLNESLCPYGLNPSNRSPKKRTSPSKHKVKLEKEEC